MGKLRVACSPPADGGVHGEFRLSDHTIELLSNRTSVG